MNNTVAPIGFANGFGSGYNYSAYATIETNGAIRYRTAQARELYHQAQFDAATNQAFLSGSMSSTHMWACKLVARALRGRAEGILHDNMHQLSDLTEKRFDAGAGTQADANVSCAWIKAYIQEKQNVLLPDVNNVNSAARAASVMPILAHPLDTPIDASEPLTYKPAPITRILPILQGRPSRIAPELGNPQTLICVR